MGSLAELIGFGSVRDTRGHAGSHGGGKHSSKLSGVSTLSLFTYWHFSTQLFNVPRGLPALFYDAGAMRATQTERQGVPNNSTLKYSGIRVCAQTADHN